MLAERSFTEIRITDIARAARVAQPNFYTYFSSIEEVVLAAAREFSADHLSVYLERDWNGPDGVSIASELVEAVIAMWRRDRGVLSTIGNLASKRGGEFADLRVSQMRPIYKGFERKVRLAQAAGRMGPELGPRVVGYECVAILGAVGERYELLRDSGFSHEELVGTTARLLHLIATGVRP